MHFNITPADAIFTLSSLVGLWYSVGILPRYFRSFRVARKLRDTTDRRNAGGLHFTVFLSESVRCAIHMSFLTLGIWSAFVEPSPVVFTDRNHTWFAGFFLFALIGTNIALTLNTIIVRRGYLSRRGGIGKPLPTRDAAASVLRRLRILERRVHAEERRNDHIEARANDAHARADIAETRADTAHARADIAEQDLDDHEGRLEIVEDATNIKRLFTGKNGDQQAER